MEAGSQRESRSADTVDSGLAGPAATGATGAPSAAAERVLAVMREASGPVTAQQIGELLGLHPTTVRFHLERLAACGHVISERHHAGSRGRPGLRYRLLPSAAASSGSAPLAEVAATWRPMVGALATALEATGRQLGTGVLRDQARAAGRRWADELWAEHPVGMVPLLARLGFSPELSGSGVRLRSCPFLASARGHREAICEIHCGLAQRLAEREGLISGQDDGTGVCLHPFAEPNACRIEIVPSSPTPSGRGTGPAAVTALAAAPATASSITPPSAPCGTTPEDAS